MSLLTALLTQVLPTVYAVDTKQPEAKTSTQNADPKSAGSGESTEKDKDDKEDVPKGAGGEKGEQVKAEGENAAKKDGDDEGGDEKEEGGEEEGKEEGKEEEEPEEEEEEEAEDEMPKIRDECGNSACISKKREFEHCEEKVHSGKARPHEDCVEELFHMMHCIDNCSAPKLFSKLV